MKLTDTQRRALRLCANHPTPVILPGHKIDRLEISYTTGWALIEAEYAQTVRQLQRPARVAATLIITLAGRAALAVPTEDIARYLAARPGPRGDYTTIKALAVAGEPEPVDEDTLKRITAQSHQIRDLKELGDIERARQQTARAIREAERVDVDLLKLRPVLKRLRANLADLERQLRKDAA